MSVSAVWDRPKAPGAIVIGAGHNGLCAAAYLARAGLRPLVLEARALIGGRAVTEEIAPGFRCSTVLHNAGPLLPAVVRELELDRHGLGWLAPDVRVFAPALDGAPVVVHDEAPRTAAALAAHSARDAAAYPGFAASIARLGAALRSINTSLAPAIEAPGAGDLVNLLGLGWGVRRLPRADRHRLLRWGPMAIADLTQEVFASPLLCAVLAARGIYATTHGPRQPGTSAGLLLQAALDGQATAPAAFPRGGMGAITAALAAAAEQAGAVIRPGVRVANVMVSGGRVRGVVLADGAEIPSPIVLSAVDPRTTFLSLVSPGELGPSFVSKVNGYRARGSAAKLNLALSRLPRFVGADEPRLLSGRIHIGADLDTLERAADPIKYGEMAARPVLDVAIPSLLDPTLAPPGAHVMSIHAQFVAQTLRKGDWRTRGPELVDNVLATLAPYAPDLRACIVGQQLITPHELEAEYGLGGGHLFHGEPALDQLYACRPLLGWARHRTPIDGLYLGGSGTHPGGPVTGAAGRNAARVVRHDVRWG